MRQSEGRSQPEGRIVRDKAEHGERTTKPSGTHFLEIASQGTSQDTESARLSKWHSLSENRIERDKLRHEKNATG